MSERRDLITSRNLLANRNCFNCGRKNICFSKLRVKYNTCAGWERMLTFDEMMLRRLVSLDVKFTYPRPVETVSVKFDLKLPEK